MLRIFKPNIAYVGSNHKYGVWVLSSKSNNREVFRIGRAWGPPSMKKFQIAKILRTNSNFFWQILSAYYIISNFIVLRICAKILKKVCVPASISSVARSQLRVARWRTRRRFLHPLGEMTPVEWICCCKVSLHTLSVFYILQSETTWRLLNGRATSWWVYLG